MCVLKKGDLVLDIDEILIRYSFICVRPLLLISRDLRANSLEEWALML